MAVVWVYPENVSKRRVKPDEDTIRLAVYTQSNILKRTGEKEKYHSVQITFPAGVVQKMGWVAGDGVVVGWDKQSKRLAIRKAVEKVDRSSFTLQGKMEGKKAKEVVGHAVRCSIAFPLSKTGVEPIDATYGSKILSVSIQGGILWAEVDEHEYV